MGFSTESQGPVIGVVVQPPLTNAVNLSRARLGSSAPSVAVWFSEDPPNNTTLYPLWWETTSGRLKVYYVTGSSAQWVDAMPVSV